MGTLILAEVLTENTQPFSQALARLMHKALTVNTS
jgi:hypothetical protein